MIKDATGRELKIGQLVELPLIGMCRAFVVNIIEAPRVLALGQQTFAPRVILQVMVENIADATTGEVPNVYVIKDPPETSRVQPQGGGAGEPS